MLHKRLRDIINPIVFVVLTIILVLIFLSNNHKSLDLHFCTDHISSQYNFYNLVPNLYIVESLYLAPKQLDIRNIHKINFHNYS